MLQITNFKKSFLGSEVLKGVGLSVKKGQVLSIIGSSGSGKSTLLRCINFLERPDYGQIMFDGKQINVSKVNHKKILEIRRNIGMVFQSHNLFSHKTVLENVMEGLLVVQKKNKQEAKKIALKYLAKVGLLDKAECYPAMISGGQQQRIGIARALALNPKLILFDEPTSALDPELVDEVLNTIRELASEGVTMIIVTHEMRFAFEISDKIILLDNGEIVEEASPAALISNPKNERTRQILYKFKIIDDYHI